MSKKRNELVGEIRGIIISFITLLGLKMCNTSLLSWYIVFTPLIGAVIVMLIGAMFGLCVCIKRMVVK